MKYYKSYRIVDGKPRWVIVDETGKVINNNPDKEELKGLKDEPRKPFDTKKGKVYYTKECLINELKRFYEENGRVPTQRDFANNPEYPNFKTYQRMFGSWENALKLVELDVDSMVKQCVLETNNQKARYAEIKVINHFKQHPIDLAGENCRSPCDGICPNGKTYDVKSSGQHMGGYYQFNTINKYREEIEIYYFLAFNKNYSKLEYAWRVPGEIVEKDYFVIGISWAKFTIDNMKEYDITDKIKMII